MAQNTSNRTYQQIEATADYYPPEIYDQLSFMVQRSGSFTSYYDTLEGDFYPLTAAKAPDHAPKMFVVGLLPPSCNVTGRLLDRSASIAQLTGVPDEIDTANGWKQAAQASSGGQGTGTRGPYFWDRYVEMCNRLGVDPRELGKALNLESGFNPGIVNGTSNAKGLNQLMPSTAKGLGMSKEEWENYQNLSGEEQLYWVEIYLKRAGARGKNGAALYRVNVGGYDGIGNPKGVIYASKAYQAAHGGTYPNPDHQDLAVKQNKGLANAEGAITYESLQAALDKLSGWQGQITVAMDRVKDSKGTPIPRPGTGEAQPGTSWDTTAAQNANKAQNGLSKQAQKSLEAAGALGATFYAEQVRTIVETARALEKMRNTPPLRMLVNPKSFKLSTEKVIQDGSWSQTGPIVEHWGDSQLRLEASGNIAGFYAMDMRDANGPGLTRIARNYSKSFQNFLSLWLIYRNNAGIYIGGHSVSQQQTLSVLGSVYIYYDNTLYLGSFDSFNVQESDANPFTLEYSYSFTVRASFLLDTVSDPRFTYGLPPAPQVSIPQVSTPSETPAYQPIVLTAEQRAEADKARNKLDSMFASPDQVMGPTPSGKLTIQSPKPKSK